MQGWCERAALLVILVIALGAGCRCQDPNPDGVDPELFDGELQQRIAAAIARLGPDYKPRTRHRNPDGSAKFTNRLILETSPYLIQHAHNPVAWYAWGEPAFERARTQNKPIFLSIGYSTCHWCHVMAEESFEDEAIAAVLNRYFVAIKVDREDRPDVDSVYMAAVQRMTGTGGWPMTVFLMPDRRPFFGGTYFPPRDDVRGGRLGLPTVLDRVRRAYAEDGDRLAADATRLVAELAAAVPERGGSMPEYSAIRAAYTQFAASFDPTWGGFGTPKFPRPAVLELLVRYFRTTGDARALHMVVRTLERMAAGGIYDPIGGGFHRYAIDAKWRVPHFEKMLYDNAQLAVIYLEAFVVTGREDFAQIVRETLDYLLRDLASPDGGFYSATDADSEGREGAYFLWTADEIDRVVGAERGRIVREYFDVTVGGNFDATRAGDNVLWRPVALEDVAARLVVPAADVRAAIAEARPKLLVARSKRSPPLTDRKILTAWNGLAISALARAALVLGEPRYRDAARNAASYLLARARGNAGLLHGVASGAAFLDDYAALAAGLIDLFEVDPDPRWLREAIALHSELDREFADPRGGYFLTASRHDAVLVREKPDRDDALPSGNSIAAANLLRLHELTGESRYRDRAEATFRALAPSVADAPTSLPALLVALDFYLDRPKQIVIVSPDAIEPTELLAEVRGAFVPNRILIRVADGAPQRELAALCPLLDGKVARKGRPTAYVCAGNYCELPTGDPAVLRMQLAKREPLAIP